MSKTLSNAKLPAVCLQHTTTVDGAVAALVSDLNVQPCPPALHITPSGDTRNRKNCTANRDGSEVFKSFSIYCELHYDQNSMEVLTSFKFYHLFRLIKILIDRSINVLSKIH